MNSQTISTRANSKHFGRPAAPRKNAGVSTTPTKQAPESVEIKTSQAPIAPPTATNENHNPPLAPGESIRETAFRIDAPTAHEVALLGDFTDWEKSPIKLIKGGGGTWHTKVKLPAGHHAYRFRVDGQWQDDPHAKGREPNPFGTANCVVEVV